MLHNLKVSISCLSLITVFAVAPVLSQAEAGDSPITPNDLKVLKRWLAAEKSNLRPATVADCQDLGGLSQAHAEWGSDYFPYYRIDDFNRDRRDDFAIALVDPTKTEDRFSVAIFHGGKSPDAAPAFLRKWDVSKRGLHAGIGLIVMGLSDQDDCEIVYWNGKQYEVKNCNAPPGRERPISTVSGAWLSSLSWHKRIFWATI